MFVYFLGVLVHMYPIPRFRVLFVFFWFYPILRVLFCVLVVLFCVLVDIFKFLLRKKESRMSFG